MACYFFLVVTKRGFGQLLKDAREQAGMTQEELAEAVAMSASMVSRWEQEIQKPAVPEQVNALVTTLPISAEQLLRAMGVSMTGPAAARLPRQLVEDLLSLPPDQLATLATLVRQLAASGPLELGKRR